MSGFYDDEPSPWASQAEEPLAPDFTTNTGDDPSPWGDSERDSNREESTSLNVNTYDPYGYNSAPLVSPLENDGESAGTAEQDGQSESELAVNREQEPEKPVNAGYLKPNRTKKPNPKKNRSGKLRVESTDTDPLAASTIHLSDVSLVRAQTDITSADVTSAETLDVLPSTLNSAGTFKNAGSDSGTLIGRKSEVNDSKSAPIVHPKVDSKFEISVSDPAFVGDMTNSHTEYTVQLSTDCEAYEVKDTAEQRRYSDFRWLYRTLVHNHPGVVVPSVPEKQALGRFNKEFLQQRRAALESTIRKMCAHTLLYKDPDLIAFLTAPDFNDYMRSRLLNDEDLKRHTRNASEDAKFGSDSGRITGGSSNAGAGFIGSLTGALSLSRGGEADPWTVDVRKTLDVMESHLRAASKDLLTISINRQHLSASMGDLASVLHVLSEVEATQRLSSTLRSFSKVHDRLASIYARERQQNLLTLEYTLEEHTRTIGSIRDAVNARQRVFSETQNLIAENAKRKATLQKQSPTQEDRRKALEEDIAAADETESKLRQRALDIAELVASEMNRVDEERIQEFRQAVEIYLETTIETQKEAIEIWETFYSRTFA